MNLEISMIDVIEQCRAYRDAAIKRGSDATAKEWQIVYEALTELTKQTGD